MANNFKSKRITVTQANSVTTLLVGAETATIVSNIVLHLSPQTSGKYHLLFTKAGTGSFPKIATHKATAVEDSVVVDMITKSFVLEENDSISFQTGSSTGTVDVVVSYMEKVTDFSTGNMSTIADVSLTDPSDGQILVYNASSGEYQPTTLGDVSDISDTSDLPQQSSGSEPWNRYMKNFGSLTELQNVGNTQTAAEVLKDSPSDIVFVGCNSGLTGNEGQPLRFTFEDVIQALLQGALEDMIADPNSPVTSELVTGTGGLGDLNGDGAVGSGDLIEFLTTFGQSWSDSSSNLFQNTRVVLEQTAGTTTAVIGGGATKLAFDLSEFTVTTPGSQNVLKDATNNLIKIQSATTVGSYPLYAIQNKELYIGAQTSIVFHGITLVADETVIITARIKLYDEDDNQLGNDVVVDVADKRVTAAGSFVIGSTAFNVVSSADIENLSGVTGGWESTDFDYLTIELEAEAAGGSDIYVGARYCNFILRTV